MNRGSNLMGLLLNRNFYETTPESHYREYKNDLGMLQRLKLEDKLEVHSGCVNTINWSTGGDYILSGSDDQCLCVTNPFQFNVKHRLKTSHASNIFSAKFLPQTGDRQVISCSASGRIIHTDLLRPEETASNIFDCIRDSVYEVVTVPNDPNSFLICSHDKTVRWYDLRVKQKCPRNESLRRHASNCYEDVLLNTNLPITALAVNPRSTWQFAIGKSDSIVSVFDRRKLGTHSLGSNQSDSVNSLITQFSYHNVKKNRITSLSYNSFGDQLLVSYSWESIYLFDLNEIRNEQEQKKAAREQEATTDDDTEIQSRRGFKRHFNVSESDALPSLPRSMSPPNERLPFNYDLRDINYVEFDAQHYNSPAEQRNNSNSARYDNPGTYQIIEPASNLFNYRYPRARYFLRTHSSSNNNDDDEDDNDNHDNDNHDNDEEENDDDDSTMNINNDDDEMSPHTRSIFGSPPLLVTPSPNRDDEPRRLSRSRRRNHEFSYKLKRDDNLTHFTTKFTKFSGHRNQKTVIKEANFWGDDFIVSGSDCGHIFFWSIHDQKPVALLKADRSVVNCVQPHPTAPILASSGIDNDIKIFSPIASENQFSKKVVDGVMANNKKTSTFDGPLHSRIVLHFYAALNRERINDSQRGFRDSNFIRDFTNGTFREIRDPQLGDDDPFH